MGDTAAARARLRDPAAEVSAHWLISPQGSVEALVPEDRRAWHAGAARWGSVEDVNSRSVGIELCNDGLSPFPAPQMAALERLLAGIVARHRIPPERVIGHSDCAPGRKVDPGARFDWARLARRGLAAAVTPETGEAPDAARLAALAARAGYTAPVGPEVILGALRLRHRPWARGPLDAVDMGVARALASRFPVD